MNNDCFEKLPIELKLSMLHDSVEDRRGRTIVTLKQEYKIERWFRSGDQWVGPKGSIVKIEPQ
jgi:hypothetical protein